MYYGNIRTCVKDFLLPFFILTNDMTKKRRNILTYKKLKYNCYFLEKNRNTNTLE